MSHRFVCFVLGLALLGLAPSAEAFDDCVTDVDCDDGLVCEEVGGSSCATPGCAPGEECPEPEPCEPEIIYGCVPAECETDADCGDSGLTCVEVSYETCMGTAVADCAPGEECPEPEPDPEPECEVESESYCLPPWMLPCEEAADCGDSAFECVEIEMCSCSGGGGSGSGGIDGPPPVPSDDPGDPDPDGEGDDDDPDDLGDDEGDCTCEPSGVRQCVPTEIECEDDSTCPDGWTCEEQGQATAPCSFDPGTGEEDCPDPEPSESLCFPPFYWGMDGDFDDAAAESALDAVTGGSGSRAAGEENDDSGGGSGGGDEADRSGSDCNVSATTPAAPLGSLLFVLGALALLRRR